MIGKVSLEAWWGDFEVNLKGTFLMTSRFLRLHERSQCATIINLVSLPTIVPPRLSSYFLSKTALIRFGEHIAAEYPNVMAFSLNPGTSVTDMTLEDFIPFSKDTRMFLYFSFYAIVLINYSGIGGRDSRISGCKETGLFARALLVCKLGCG
jgi:NAD(P)-dependent dehydrogenase (short-subunit alcohol dehydrogenase family)